MALWSASSAHAQYFKHNAMQVPSIGWLILDKSWYATDQLTFGVGYLGLIDDDWWLTVDVAQVGFGSWLTLNPATQKFEKVPQKGAGTLVIGPGIRYNFLPHATRPYLGAKVQYVRFFSDSNFWNFSSPESNWIGTVAVLGLEWFFTGDISLDVEANGSLLFNFNQPMRLSALLKLGMNVYF